MKPKVAKLQKGQVVRSTLEPEVIQAPVTKLMKVIAIERRPGQQIAQLELRVEAGVYLIHIDEATARAIASIFDA